MTSSSPSNNSGKEIVTVSDSESQLSSLSALFSHNRSLSESAGRDEQHAEDDKNSAGIMEEIDKSKDSVFQRKKSLEEERDHFQKAAFAVLDMLNGRNLN